MIQEYYPERTQKITVDRIAQLQNYYCSVCGKRLPRGVVSNICPPCLEEAPQDDMEQQEKDG